LSHAGFENPPEILMRVLHISKTSEGGRWAALQVRELLRAGVEVEVALPSLAGRAMDLWKSTGARLHAVDLSFPLRRPWLAAAVAGRARRLLDRVEPDLIHSHFVSTTLTLRAALGANAHVPRLFQVPGPLHLEHWLYRAGELAAAGTADYWIASSRCTRDLYLRAGVEPGRVFLSYYPIENPPPSASAGADLRARWGIPRAAEVVGNINMFYKPKRHLGQRTGLKAHEHVLEALRLVIAERANVYGVLAGGPWGNAQKYFASLEARAVKIAGGRILLPGLLAPAQVAAAWREFACAVHVPLSENCGGVVEPLLAGVPVIAGRIGGLPEVVIEGVSGITVPIRDPRALADAILQVLDRPEPYRAMAGIGGQLVARMFSAARTAAEIKVIYEYVLGARSAPPPAFDSRTAITEAYATGH
jgi:glycosyltransferase involved in cell wall biosynthesis